MPFRKSSSMDSAGIARVAQGWGKVVARLLEEELGPDLDLDLDADQIERYANGAACAVARGAIEELLEKEAALPGAEQSCPTCHRLRPVERQPRIIHFWGGEVAYSEPMGHCPACRRDFFPSTPGFAPHTA